MTNAAHMVFPGQVVMTPWGVPAHVARVDQGMVWLYGWTAPVPLVRCAEHSGEAGGGDRDGGEPWVTCPGTAHLYPDFAGPLGVKPARLVSLALAA